MNAIVKNICRQYGIPEHMALKLIMPELGEEFIVRGIVYKVVYIKENELQFSAKPIRAAIPQKAKANLTMLGLVQKVKRLIRR